MGPLFNCYSACLIKKSSSSLPKFPQVFLGSWDLQRQIIVWKWWKGIMNFLYGYFPDSLFLLTSIFSVLWLTVLCQHFSILSLRHNRFMENVSSSFSYRRSFFSHGKKIVRNLETEVNFNAHCVALISPEEEEKFANRFKAIIRLC